MKNQAVTSCFARIFRISTFLRFSCYTRAVVFVVVVFVVVVFVDVDVVVVVVVHTLANSKIPLNSVED